MSDTFSPKTCDANQWRVWLRDGGRLYARSLSSWGLLMVVVYLALGWVAHRYDLGTVVMVALSGVLQLSHLAVMDSLRSGQVGFGAVLKAVFSLWRDHRALLLRTIKVRGLVILGIFLTMMALGLLLALISAPPASTVPAAAAPVTWWTELSGAASELYTGAVFPYFLQIGGSVSFVLPLMREGLDTSSARRLDAMATLRNLHGVRQLSLAFMIVAIVSIFIPLLGPFLVVYWMAVTSCAYADIFQGGYKIEALATAPAKLREANAFTAAHGGA